MKRRIVILAEKKLGPLTSKMANGVIRFLPEEVVAVVDSRYGGNTVQQVLDFGGTIPIVSTLEEALSFHPNTMLIGISPPAGEFPTDWYPLIIQALQNKLHIISGLHDLLGEIQEFKVLAEKYNVKITDLRKNTQAATLARGLARNFKSKIILTIGTHGNVGKMTSTIEMVKQLQKMGKSADWLATGQIGILIKGKGIPLDAIKGDFLSGAVESALAQLDGKYEYIIIEGQGSLQHLGYSSVSTALLHGSLPDAMILCHRTDVGITDYGIDTDNLHNAIALHENLLSFVKPAKVIAISLNTYNLSKNKAGELIESIHRNTGLAVTDPMRFDGKILAEAILEYFSNVSKNLSDGI
jgi:D-glutamate N-acetyltransferase